MTRDQTFVLVLLVAIFNGIFSPWVFLAVGFAPAWLPSFLPYDPRVLFYGASLLVSTLTLLVSGVPAALAERILREEVGPDGALWVWLAGALLLSLPAIQSLIGQI